MSSPTATGPTTVALIGPPVLLAIWRPPTELTAPSVRVWGAPLEIRPWRVKSLLAKIVPVAHDSPPRSELRPRHGVPDPTVIVWLMLVVVPDGPKNRSA